MGVTLLHAQALSKTYGDRVVLEAISLSVDAGQIVGLLGPNGTGKSTTMKLLAGAAVPDAGSVSVAGHDLAKDPMAARSTLGFVPDVGGLLPRLTAREHLAMVGRVRRVTGWAAGAGELLHRLELDGAADARVQTFSHGMCRKLSIALALLAQPQVLLLDEPFDGVDPRGVRILCDLIAEHAGRGGAVLLSTHLLSAAERMCPHLYVLAYGRIVAEGSPGKLRELSGLGADAAVDDVYLTLTRPGEPAGR